MGAMSFGKSTYFELMQQRFAGLIPSMRIDFQSRFVENGADIFWGSEVGMVIWSYFGVLCVPLQEGYGSFQEGVEEVY